MKIGLDVCYSGYPNKPRDGVYQYVYYFVNELGNVSSIDDYTLFFCSLRKKHHEYFQEYYRQLDYKFKKRAVRFPSRIWRQYRLPIEAFTGRNQLFHGLYEYVPPVLWGKSIVTIFGLVNFRKPDFLEQEWLKLGRRNVANSAKRADMIIAISKATKRDIIEYFDIPEERIRVVHLGAPSDFCPANERSIIEMTRKYDIEGKYILFVGRLDPRKNLENLLHAYRDLLVNWECGHKLVIAGPNGWEHEKTFDLARNLKIDDKVIFTGFIPNRELPVLYSGADLFVLPSVDEDFGIVVLEAMACGVPVVASRARGIPESVGNAGILVNPNSIREIAEKIHLVLTERKLREDLIRKGFERARKLTWRETARQTVQVYQEVLGKA